MADCHPAHQGGRADRLAHRVRQVHPAGHWGLPEARQETRLVLLVHPARQGHRDHRDHPAPLAGRARWGRPAPADVVQAPMAAPRAAGTRGDPTDVEAC